MTRHMMRRIDGVAFMGAVLSLIGLFVWLFVTSM